jgi:hypothetical protein
MRHDSPQPRMSSKLRNRMIGCMAMILFMAAAWHWNPWSKLASRAIGQSATRPTFQRTITPSTRPNQGRFYSSNQAMLDLHRLQGELSFMQDHMQRVQSRGQSDADIQSVQSAIDNLQTQVQNATAATQPGT